MTAQARNNKWFGMKEGHKMETFGNHAEMMRAFRQSHTDVQDIALVEVESFEVHDERMKLFRRNHPDIPEPIAANAGEKQSIPNEDEWSILVTYSSVTEHRFSPN